jgi:hypothetical protein
MTVPARAGLTPSDPCLLVTLNRNDYGFLTPVTT